MPLLDEIAARLVAQGVGTVGGDIFMGSKAVIPAGGVGPYLSLTETGGSGSKRTHNGTPVAQPTVHILSRAKAYNVARAKIVLAWNALGGDKGLHNITLSGTFYQSITPRQQLTDIGLDAEARPCIVFNIEAEKAPS